MPAESATEASPPEEGSVDEKAGEKTVEAFIKRWSVSGASEQANYQLFLAELARLLGVEEPRPATDRAGANDYCFERRVDQPGGTPGFIDLYKEGCFVLEAKQGSDAVEPTEAEALAGDGGALRRKMGTARRGTRGWGQAMQRAKRQAMRYARALPEEDGWPPFLAVVDVGYCIDLYADFARQGKTYVQFPGPDSFRIELEDLRDPGIRERLRKVWTDPLALDPSRRAARVTRDLAEKLGRLASALEESGHEPDRVAGFLMRSLFTMFAEDAGLIPEGGFTELLVDYQGGDLEMLPQALSHLWETMNEGGFSPALRTQVRQFNGALFSDAEALPLSEAQRALLAEAAAADWSEVEPAIFGTLLERALDPRERHRLGAHYTPRAYVERLVQPTIIEPLRAVWEAAQAAAASREAEGHGAGAAVEEIRQFHRRLCSARVLDPACGSGNFLYVTLEHLKRLEAEVLQSLEGYGASTGLDMTGGNRVGPEQLLGLEVNPRAARIADVVLWIGYLQWHLRSHGSADRLDEPILRAYGNIEERDALITYDEKHPRVGEDGEPLTRWDRRTTREHPTTGEMVPDERAQEPVYDYPGPEVADWPEADFIIGNPPFVGTKRMQEVLGEGYTEAVRSAYLRRVPKSADFVMFWWYKAAKLVRKGEAERFGFVSTNSIRQTFNRRVIDKQMNASPPLALAFAIPDHPWVDGTSGAAVRIALTVGMAESQPGTLQTVRREEKSEGLHRTVNLAEQSGNVLANLTIGPDVAGAEALEANAGLSHVGVQLNGSGFLVSPERAAQLGRGEDERLQPRIRPYWTGTNLIEGAAREDLVIDLFGLEIEEVRKRFPAVYQHVRDHVKPERDQTRRKKIRELWWIHGWERPDMRDALEGLDRYIATVETSKHRFFTFLDEEALVNNTVVAVALDDAFALGVLSSRIHVTWALAAGGTLEDRPRYNKTQCFDPFPFPAASEEEKEAIREVAESLDTHRKERLAEHEDLTMTALYNVMKKERAGEALSEAEKETHQQGLVGVLRELHDEIDEAVAAAYGWEAGLAEEEVLGRLVALNAKRRAEEEQGRVGWLRPALQAPEETQAALEMETNASGGEEAAAEVQPRPWPDELAERVQAVQGVVAASEEALTVEEVATRFRYARRKQVRSILETLEALGQVRQVEQGQFAG